MNRVKVRRPAIRFGSSPSRARDFAIDGRTDRLGRQGQKADRMAAPAARRVRTVQVRSGHFGSRSRSGASSDIGDPPVLFGIYQADTSDTGVRMKAPQGLGFAPVTCECLSISQTRG
jgi:hypothetical protein